MSAALPIADVAARLMARLRAGGIEHAALEARVLIRHVAGVSAEQVVATPHALLSGAEFDALARLAARRCGGEPMARLVGHREFWSLDIAVSAETLVPRPDSETVVEAALAALPDRARPWRLLDLGTGSGCLLLALLSELPAAFGVGVDIAEGAVATARGNAAALGLGGRAAFLTGDWGTALGGARFDLIVANPPYVADGAIDGLQREVAKHEPRRALAGGADGLAAYRALATQLCRLLAGRGVAVLEHGAGQADKVCGILAANGLAITGRRRDLAGRERCVIATFP
jgi:release factor glutamine methyltransferase